MKREKEGQGHEGWTKKALPTVANQQQEPELTQPCPLCGTFASRCQYDDAKRQATICSYTDARVGKRWGKQ